METLSEKLDLLIGGFSDLDALLEEAEDKEPTTEELMALEKEGKNAEEGEEDLNDLDALLAESMTQAKARRKQAKQAFRDGRQTPAPLPLGEGWHTHFTCAIFEQRICSTCHDTITVFSHWATFQELGKGRAFQWLRASKPHENTKVSVPRFIRNQVDICPHCYSTKNAVLFSATSEVKVEKDERQLNLFDWSPAISAEAEETEELEESVIVVEQLMHWTAYVQSKVIFSSRRLQAFCLHKIENDPRYLI